MSKLSIFSIFASHENNSNAANNNTDKNERFLYEIMIFFKDVLMIMT